MKKQLFTLLTLLLCAVSTMWADVTYYTPKADEVIILNDVYSATATTTGYSTHEAITWAGTASASSKKTGDPSNSGAPTSSNVDCYSIKGNGKGKNITINITGVSKITIYHESHNSRYVELKSGSKDGTLIGKGSANTYFTEVDLTGATEYSIFLHGTSGSDDQDICVYAIKLTKYVNKQIATEAFAGVKVGGTGLTENEAENGYSINNTTVTLTDVSYVKPNTVTLTNHVTYTDKTAEDKNVSVTFSDTPAGGYWTGTATIGETEYTVKVPYSAQTVTSINLNGSNIDAEYIATLNSTKAVTIDGSSLNGIGTINVTLSEGTATVSRANSEDDAVFTFTINGNEVHTVTISNIKKTYTAEGKVFSATSTLNANTHTCNGITFTQTNTGKNFQYGTARVTISGEELVPVKLSTGSAVNVTFPENKVATKVIVYGWSAQGNGKLNSMSETNEGIKSVNVQNDIFYATNTADDLYPSVYEYDLDNWESLYFNPGGSPSQPFVVMDFVLIDKPTNIPATISSAGYATFSSTYPVDIDNATPAGLKAYKATESNGSTVKMIEVTGTVAANTGLVLKGDAGTYNIPVAASGTAVEGNLLHDCDGSWSTLNVGNGGTNYVLSVQNATVVWAPVTSDTPEMSAGQAYLYVPATTSTGAHALTLSFGEDVTGINTVKTSEPQADQIYYNLQGQRVIEPKQGIYVVDGKKVLVK